MQMKRALGMILAVAMLVTLVTGCGQQATQEVIPEGSASSSETEQQTNLERPIGIEDGYDPANGTYYKVDPGVTITTAQGAQTFAPYKNGETIEDNVYTRWVKDTLGITLDVEWSLPPADFDNKVKLMISAGEEFPDVMKVFDKAVLKMLYESGNALVISEGLEKYGSERMKGWYNEFPEVFYGVTAENGDVYALPMFGGGNESSTCTIWYRQDWLDNLGLEIPKTIEEYEKVLDAFTNNDPDGNGKNDTIGLSVSAGTSNGYSTWMSDVSFLFGAMSGNEIPGRWALLNDGTLGYGSIQPSSKSALEVLNRWYKNGYIDKEYMTYDQTKASESFTNGRSGSFVCAGWAWNWPLAGMEDNIEGCVLSTAAVPTGPNGETSFWAENNDWGFLVINPKAADKLREIFYYLDANYSPTLGEGAFKNGWFEGYDYVKLADGSISRKPDDIPGGYTEPGAYSVNGNTFRIPYRTYLNAKAIMNGAEPTNILEITVASFGKAGQNAAAIASEKHLIEAGKRSANKFQGVPTDTMLATKDFLDKLELDTYHKIVTGELPLDYFDTFVKEWLEKGGADNTKEVNDWWSTVK